VIGSPYRESESSLAGKKVENIYLGVYDMGDYTEIFRGGYEEIAEVANKTLFGISNGIVQCIVKELWK